MSRGVAVITVGELGSEAKKFSYTLWRESFCFAYLVAWSNKANCLSLSLKENPGMEPLVVGLI